MSVYQARYDAGRLGFFDFAGHVCLLPDGGVDPRAVLEHECTHINVANCSVTGLVEDVLRIHWDEVLGTDEEAVGRLHALRVAMKAQCEHVQEVAAWFTTRACRSYPDPVRGPDTPPDYLPDVRRLWSLQSSADGLESPMEAVDVVEACASRALSPPGLADACLASWPFTSGDDLMSTLSTSGTPVDRFRRIVKDAFTMAAHERRRLCDELWSRSDTTGPVPWVARGELGPEAPVRLMVRVGEHIGNPLSESDATMLWDAAKVSRFQPQMDRYAQICVIQPTRAKAVPPQLAGLAADLDPYMIASVHARGGHEFEHSAGPVLTGPIKVGLSWWKPADLVGRVTEIELPALRHALDQPAVARVVSSGGYDFDRAELTGAVGVLEDLPHAVLAATPFPDLWRRLGLEAGLVGCEPGIHGDTTVEFAAVPSGLGTAYSHLLLKPRSRDWPVVCVPMVSDGIERALSWSQRPDVAEAGGVSLQSASAPTLRDWAGASLPHACAAIAAFEGWFSAGS